MRLMTLLILIADPITVLFGTCEQQDIARDWFCGAPLVLSLYHVGTFGAARRRQGRKELPLR